MLVALCLLPIIVIPTILAVILLDALFDDSPWVR